MQLPNYPRVNDLKVIDLVSINSVNAIEGYTCLGFSLSYANDVSRLIEFNFNKKKINIAKFYSWLHLIESSPFPLKLTVCIEWVYVLTNFI